jgi:uncharacterized protein (TIGR03066 family)
MKRLSTLALGVVVLALAGSASAQDDYGKKIVGKWKVTKSDADVPAGTVIEFTKDGKLSAVIKIENQELKVEGTYKIEKDKLLTKVKIGDQTHDDTDTIKKLTDTDLELEDSDKKITVLKKEK